MATMSIEAARAQLDRIDEYAFQEVRSPSLDTPEAPEVSLRMITGPQIRELVKAPNILAECIEGVLLALGEMDGSFRHFKTVTADIRAFIDRMKAVDPEKTTVGHAQHARIKAIVE
jgi:hypothetical protein